MDGQGYSLDPPDIPEPIFEQLEQQAAEKKYRWMVFTCRETVDYLKELREKIKQVEGFWGFTLLSHAALRAFITSRSDQQALSFLTDVELIQDPKDPRPFEIIFHFKENPYFSNTTLSKKYTLKSNVAPAPEDGSVTKEMHDFDEESLDAPAVKIDWKSDDKNLCHKQPRQVAKHHPDEQEDDNGDIDGDLGSFFWYFQEDGDRLGIGAVLQDDILPNAFDYTTGRGENAAESESVEEDELDESDDAGSIDLEAEEDQPARKRARK